MSNLVVVCSAICTNNEPLSYTPTRSKFTHAERYQQTLQTLKKVREKVPDCFIVLVEATLLQEEYYSGLSKLADHILLTAGIKEVFVATESPYKGWGEACCLLCYLLSEHFQERKEGFKSMSKISGRYYPNEHFVFECRAEGVVCKVDYNNPCHSSGVNMSTMFYTLPISLVDVFVQALREVCSGMEMQSGVALEHILPLTMLKNGMVLLRKDMLQVEGEYGPWGGFVRH